MTFVCSDLLLLFTLVFPPRDSLIPGWSPLVCSIGLTESMSRMSLAREEILDVMWRFAAVGTDGETSILLYSALKTYRSLGVYNIRILTVRGWRVPSWLGLFPDLLIGCGRSSSSDL